MYAILFEDISRNRVNRDDAFTFSIIARTTWAYLTYSVAIWTSNLYFVRTK